MERVHERWNSLQRELSVSKSVAAVWWTGLRDQYSEPGRHYHTLEHVRDLLDLLDTHAPSVGDACAVALAIFFHDVVYDARGGGAGRNESDSAAQFEQWHSAAGAPLGDARAHKVSGWIQATDVARRSAHTLQHLEVDSDGQLFLDMDLAVLAKPWGGYQEYAARCRAEFSHVPEAVWAWGRACFLQRLQRLPRIYTSPQFSMHEAAARSNLARERGMLRRRLVCAYLAPALALLGTAVPGQGRLVTWARSLSKVGLASLAMLRLGRFALLDRQLIAYPYPRVVPGNKRFTDVLFASSFNPPHLGHLQILQYLTTIADTVHAVIAVNPHKTYVVSAARRQELLRLMLNEVGLGEDNDGGVREAVCSGYVWVYGKQVGAKVMYRGIRSWKQDGVAEKCLECLNTIGPWLIAQEPPIPTRYLQAPPAYAHISSSLIRERAKRKQCVDDLVPPGVARQVIESYASSDHVM